MTRTVEEAMKDWDQDKATKEGWGLFDLCEDRPDRIQLQRIDDPDDRDEPVFSDDKEAWEHVWKQAQGGSPYHMKALEILGEISPKELENIKGLVGYPLKEEEV